MPEDVPKLSIARDDGAQPAACKTAPFLRVLHPAATTDGLPVRKTCAGDIAGMFKAAHLSCC